MACVAPVYRPRDAEHTVLHQVVAEHLEAFLGAVAEAGDGAGLPQFVEREFREFGIGSWGLLGRPVSEYGFYVFYRGLAAATKLGLVLGPRGCAMGAWTSSLASISTRSDSGSSTSPCSTPRPREEPGEFHRKKQRTNDGRIYAPPALEDEENLELLGFDDSAIVNSPGAVFIILPREVHEREFPGCKEH